MLLQAGCSLVAYGQPGMSSQQKRCAWRCKLGLPAAVALLMVVMLKMALLPVLHMQRLRLELKRLELLLEAR
jgi:hypothetical protein